jgi:hypothetical protein
MSEEYEVSGDQTTDAAGPVDAAANESYAEEKQSGESKNIPVEALQAERQERQRLQDELKVIKDHLSLLQSNREYQQQAPKPKDEFDGMSDDDVLTVGEFKKALQSKEKQYQMNLEEVRMTQKYPDYTETITKYLPEVLKQNPGLQKSLAQTQDYELAYYLAKNSDSYKTEHKKVKKNADAERIVQNANKAGSLSSVGHTSPINEARRWKDMSDSDFKKAMQKNLGYY